MYCVTRKSGDIFLLIKGNKMDKVKALALKVKDVVLRLKEQDLLISFLIGVVVGWLVL